MEMFFEELARHGHRLPHGGELEIEDLALPLDAHAHSVPRTVTPAARGDE
jgi:hypothetical protein